MVAPAAGTRQCLKKLLPQELIAPCPGLQDVNGLILPQTQHTHGTQLQLFPTMAKPVWCCRACRPARLATVFRDAVLPQALTERPAAGADFGLPGRVNFPQFYSRKRRFALLKREDCLFSFIQSLRWRSATVA